MKTPFYSYDFSYDNKVVGKLFPQIEKLEGGFYHQISELKNEEVLGLKKNGEYLFPESVFMGIGKLNSKSKLTDFISDRSSFSAFSLSYMIVSSDILKILKQYDLREHAAYHIPILHKKRVFKYYFLSINNPWQVSEENSSSKPDIVNIRDRFSVRPYFSERIHEEFLKRDKLGLEVSDTIYI